MLWYMTVECGMCKMGAYGKCRAVCQETTGAMCIILTAVIFSLKINLQGLAQIIINPLHKLYVYHKCYPEAHYTATLHYIMIVILMMMMLMIIVMRTMMKPL